MTDQPTKSFWNPTMITTWCAVGTFILLLLGIICSGAVYVGIMMERNATMQRDILEAKRSAKSAESIALTGKPIEEEENSEQEGKK